MAEINETQRKKIVKVGQLETFAELVDTLYGSTMGASGQNHAPGQVPDPGAIAGTSKFLCEDGTWKEPSGGSGGGNISVMGGSGSGHASGLVPDPGATAGTSKYLREDGTWAEPTGGGASNGAYLGDSNGTAFQAEFDPQTDTVWNKSQTLTSAQKEQVKINLGLQDIPGNATQSTAGLMSASDKIKLDNIRNITISSSEPTSQDGQNGDIWLVYDAS